MELRCHDMELQYHGMEHDHVTELHTFNWHLYKTFSSINQLLKTKSQSCAKESLTQLKWIWGIIAMFIVFLFISDYKSIRRSRKTSQPGFPSLESYRCQHVWVQCVRQNLLFEAYLGRFEFKKFFYKKISSKVAAAAQSVFKPWVWEIDNCLWPRMTMRNQHPGGLFHPLLQKRLKSA